MFGMMVLFLLDLPAIVVRVWSSKSETDVSDELLVQVDVHLPSLVYVSKEVAALPSSAGHIQLSVGAQVLLPPNSVLFYLKEGTFCLPNDDVFCV